MCIKKFLILVTLILLTGCLPTKKPDPTLSSVNKSPTSSKIPASETKISNNTPSSPALTQTAIPIPAKPTATCQRTPTKPISTPNPQETPTPGPFDFQYLCPAVMEDLYPENVLTGTIVLGGEDFIFQDQQYIPEGDKKSVLLFWNTVTNEKTSYSLEKRLVYYYFVTSLNHKWLALTEGKTLQLDTNVTVLSNQGQEVGKIPLPGDWTLFDWLDKDQLMIRRYRTRGEEQGMFAINPFTGERQDLPFDFPDFYSQVPLDSWGAYTVFNPILTRVVYPHITGRERLAILWDLQSSKEITRIPEPYWMVWSPDGSKLAYLEENGDFPDIWEEIYLINREGEVSRATYFQEHFDRYSIHKPVWSPDGRYIAFWLQTWFYDPDHTDRSANLVILDILTSQLMFYCLQADPNTRRGYPGDDALFGYQYEQVTSAPPIWSPDSQFLLIETYNQDNRDYKYTYLVSVMDKYWTIKLAENARPVGWLTSP
jgi:hypothetical protein